MTKPEIEAAIVKETRTSHAIVDFFFGSNNKPVDYFTLMTIASDAAVARATERLLDLTVLELVPVPGRALMQAGH
jgi:hypothetical protein